MHPITPLEQLDATRFESPAILKKLTISRSLISCQLHLLNVAPNLKEIA